MTMREGFVTSLFCAGVSAGLVLLLSTGITVMVGAAGPAAKDPGARAAAAGAGTPLSTLSADQLAFFQDGLTRFNAIDSVGGTVAGETDAGLGPTYNSTSCGSCHAQPATGGTSPSTNPQIAAAADNGATNSIPDFISASGPVREVSFPFLPPCRRGLPRSPPG